MLATTLRSAPGRASALLVGTAVAAGLCACAPQAPDTGTVDRVLLSPTADPSTVQTVTWRVSGAEESFLEIEPEDGSGQATRLQGRPTGGGEADSTFAATATGLEPDTAYRYRIGEGGEEGGEEDGDGGEDGLSDWYGFTTAAEGNEPFSFLYFGDVQDDIADEAAPVIRAALEAEPGARLALHSGDLVDSAGDDSQWDAWFDAFGPLATGGMNHLAVPGNHDYGSEGLSEHWAPQFPGAGNGPEEPEGLARTVYHTDYQGVRFVALDSNHRDAAPHSADRWLDTQRRWLEQVLADNPHQWTVVTFHHPVFSSNPERDGDTLRRAWLPVLEEYDVDLVLQGHDHSYSRGNLTEHRTRDPDVQTGPVYVVAVTGPKMYEAAEDDWTDHGAEVRVQRTGVQTFQTVSVDHDTMVYRADTAQGESVDSFTIVKEGDGKRVIDGH
ncbi:metallophosphoesterase [Nocardiopsis sp. TSRI0078]|uniref:purple acid phosphatase family protein n=1 Tax=unclassified Nocardiopsis TaxID=2649073 RepID=UPI00093F9A1A|nr:metallophosphoesterase family protein [Nocardiopsis sp. TSRI0078]OKI17029.1 metallophosphoesterase [Nocardiopsis sp. TSRI0078]